MSRGFLGYSQTSFALKKGKRKKSHRDPQCLVLMQDLVLFLDFIGREEGRAQVLSTETVIERCALWCICTFIALDKFIFVDAICEGFS